MRKTTLLVATVLASGGVMRPAEAQVEVERKLYHLTVEAWGNLTAACDAGTHGPVSEKGCGARLDGAVRLIGLAKAGGGWAVGPRVVLQSSPEDKFGVGERSVLFLTPAGRFEVGRRQGLPDVLIGYSPNTFTFTSAEYGPATGPGLDPDGRLPTAFLDPILARQIDSLSTLGFAASYYLDQSFKIIYVPQRKAGFQGGVSFAPNMDERTGPFQQLVQTGLTYEFYTLDNIFRLGGTYTFAHGDARTVGGGLSGDLHSASFGGTAVLHDRLIVGASCTYNGASGLPRAASLPTPVAAFGYSASVNYKVGPWTMGGYYQSARGEGDITLAGADHLRVVQLGASYRLNPRFRIYGSSYLYRFRDDGGASGRLRGAVFLLGTRVTL